MVQPSDYLTIIMGVLGIGAGAWMSSQKRALMRRSGIGMMAASLFALVCWFVFYRDSTTPAAAQSPATTCSNSVGGNNSGNLSNNCPTIINPLPPHADNRFYQNEQPVAAIDARGMKIEGDTITFPLIWNTQNMDFSLPFYYKKWKLQLVSAGFAERTLIGIAPDGQQANNLTPNVVCRIIGTL